MAKTFNMQPTNEKTDTFEDKLKKVLGDVTLLVLQLLWSGYVLSVLWSWFMAPIFKLPALSIIEALGVVLVLQWIRSPIASDVSQKMTTTNPDGHKYEVVLTAVPKSFWMRWWYGFGTPLIVLAMGWIYRWFM